MAEPAVDVVAVDVAVAEAAVDVAVAEAAVVGADAAAADVEAAAEEAVRTPVPQPPRWRWRRSSTLNSPAG